MTVGILLLGSPAIYLGPGNVRSGWTAWGGFRAHSLETCGTSCVDIYNTVSTVTQTFNTLANGSLDLASIATFLGASAGKVAKIWDQTGNGWHWTQATPANMPDYIASIPSLGGKPGMFFKKANSTVLVSANNSLSTSTGTMSAVAGRLIDDPTINGVLTSGTSSTGICFNSARDAAQGYAGTASGSPCLDLSSHAIDCVFNGVSSFSCIDGSIRTYDAGANTLNGSNFKVGNNLTGVVSEFGFHSAMFTQAECLAQSANKNIYWFNSTLYEGLVATRLRRLETSDGTNRYVQSRTGHVASENLTAIAIAFENQSGASATLTQAIEYPAGTFTQVTWLGATSYTYSTIYAIISDYIPISIPAGATFWIRSYYADSIAGCFYNTWQNSFYGEATTLSTTALTDLTMGGTITNSGAFSMPPCGIIGLTTNPSWFVCGDSLAMGVGDSEDTTNTATGRDGKVGIIARSLGSVPFLNCGVSGANSMPSGCGRIVGKASHVINQIGINTLRGGASSATLTTAIAVFLSLLKPKQRRYQTTITTSGTSTDGFVTVGNQTPHSSNAQRILFNDSLRALTSGLSLTGVINACDQLESSLDSGAWIVSPTPPYTGDGLHPNVAGYLIVKNANLVPTPVWP